MVEFKKNIDWNIKFKACKLWAKKDKNGNTYMTGELSRTIMVMIQKNTGQYAKEGEYTLSFVPIKYEKIEAPSQAPQAQANGTEEVPF